MQYVIGVDIGGTCTDCVVVDDLGRVTLGKAFSTPPDFSEGVVDAVEVAAKEMGTDSPALLENTRLFLHGSTIAENAIVDGTLARGGLLVTRGYEETLFMTRGPYGRWSGLPEGEQKNPIEMNKVPPLIPFPRIKGIRERTDCEGHILVKADKGDIERAIQELMENGAETIGVCFLWSFRNPDNENMVKKIVQKLYPRLFFTTSNELAPILGEYERTSTVALNISLGPVVAKYFASLGRKLKRKGFNGIPLIMQAYGGLLRAEEASKAPVGMIESGPVSGLVGSKSLGDTIGFNNIIAADMGGTTFKAGVIREGVIEYQREPMVFRYHYVLPKMDVISIGLAGGSIISLDPRSSAPKIGPRSAGAHPGPVCYGFGGTEPTVTDVDLLLGYLNPQFFLGGRAALDKEVTLRAFKSKIADPLGMNVMEAAAALYRLTNSMLYDMVHKITVERGLDPKDYALFAYGGTAGMHMTSIAEELNVSCVIIPHSASVHGAFGLVGADIVHEHQTVYPMMVPADVGEVNDIFMKLRDKAMEELRSEGLKDEDMVIRRAIDMRYTRQVHVVTTPVEAEGTLTTNDLERTCACFERLYEERYGKGSGYREAGMYMVTFKLRGIGKLRKPEIKGQELTTSDPGAALVETRKAYFDNVRDMRNARCYDFVKLLPGNEVAGPSIIWTPITTIVVNPGQRAFCDRYKNIKISKAQ